MNKIITLFTIITIFISCADKGIEGYVGEEIVIAAKNPDQTNDVDYTWILIEQPDGSLLNSSDLVSSDGGMKMIFEPDYPGNYIVDVVVSKYGDEISNQSWAFSIENADEVNQDNLKTDTPKNSDPPEDWLNEELSEEDIADETLDDEAFDDNIEEEDYNESDYENSNQENIEASPVVEIPTEVIASPIKKPILESKPAAKKRIASIPERTDRYTIQVVSKKLLKDAESYADKLIGQGFDAYIQKVIFQQSDQIFYRVRIGSYDNINSAYETAKEVSKQLGMATWVDFVRKEQNTN